MVRTFLQPWSGDNELKKNHKPAPLATNSTVADLECVKGVVDGCILKTDGLNLFGLFGEDRSLGKIDLYTVPLTPKMNK
jgi:hypothetical protein